MAGMAGLEPAMRESKSRALTAWLHPIIVRLGQRGMEKAKGRSRSSGPFAMSGVGEGTRTLDTRNHNPMLYQLNYAHHMKLCGQKRDGTPEGTRTPDPLLRRQLLYPPELQAHMERVMGIEPTRPAWKAGILPLNYTRTGLTDAMSALI